MQNKLFNTCYCLLVCHLLFFFFKIHLHADSPNFKKIHQICRLQLEHNISTQDALFNQKVDVFLINLCKYVCTHQNGLTIAEISKSIYLRIVFTLITGILLNFETFSCLLMCLNYSCMYGKQRKP